MLLWPRSGEADLGFYKGSSVPTERSLGEDDGPSSATAASARSSRPPLSSDRVTPTCANSCVLATPSGPRTGAWLQAPRPRVGTVRGLALRRVTQDKGLHGSPDAGFLGKPSLVKLRCIAKGRGRGRKRDNARSPRAGRLHISKDAVSPFITSAGKAGVSLRGEKDESSWFQDAARSLLEAFPSDLGGSSKSPDGGGRDDAKSDF